VGRGAWGAGAEVGELGAGQSVQSEAQQVVGLVGVVHDLLQFVENVAVVRRGWVSRCC